MGLLANFRRHQLRAPQLLAAFIAIVWFGSAVEPCQASMATAHAGTSQHDSMTDGSCGHCQDTTSSSDAPCAMLSAGDCQMTGQAIVKRFQTDDSQPPATPPPAALNSDPPASGINSPAEAWIRPTPVPRASIQQRYCTYLK
jgi:hypothetical protein